MGNSIKTYIFVYISTQSAEAHCALHKPIAKSSSKKSKENYENYKVESFEKIVM